jgi:glycosyltransferase involved in cell wall biosynthesis
MSDRVKVLRVIARLNMGGPALHVAYLTAGLSERGYDTTLVAGSLARGESSMQFVARDLGIRVLRLAQLHRDISPLYDTLAVLRLVSIIRRERPQILHTHTAKAGAIGRVAAVLSGNARPPVIVHTFHGHVLRGYFNSIVTAAFQRIERVLAGTATRLVAVSPQVRDDLVALGVAPEERFSVVRLGIDLQARIASETGDDLRRLFGVGDRFVVGWVGRMTPVKRTDDILAAFKGLRDRGVDAVLCLVGDGPDRRHVEQRAHDLRIARHCLFVGYQRDVSPYYGFFDVFLLPSANEGTPVVAIESLAAERPVIATAVGGTPDVVRDGVDGFLVRAGDVDAIVERLQQLARDPELAAQMGAAGRARVVPRYAVTRLIDDIDALYRDLLEGQGLGSPTPSSGPSGHETR